MFWPVPAGSKPASLSRWISSLWRAGSTGGVPDEVAAKPGAALPDATRVMVGHDYPTAPSAAAYCSDLGSEKRGNAHLNASTSREDFVAFREQRDSTLVLPELFFFALQINVRGGRFPAQPASGTRQLHVPVHLPQNWTV